MSAASNSIDNEAHSDLPQFVEPECDPETQMATEKEAEPDPCCTRCRSECRYPGLFSIQEGDQVLDIPASFGPTSWHARLIKFCLMVWFCASLIHGWYDHRDNAAFFLAWLTHWSLIFCCLWLIISFVNSLWPPAQPKQPSDSVSLRTKFSWLMFPVAAHFTLITVILYWATVFEPGVTVLSYWDVFTHACVLLVWPEGLVVNRIPIRWKHLPLPMFLAACYVSWMAIHQLLATNIGNPEKSDKDPETNDDLLYAAVDFKGTTAFSTVLVVAVVFVVTPLQHWLLWALSLYSFPCNCSGQNRRYLPLESVGATTPRAEPKSMVNVNIYEP